MSTITPNQTLIENWEVKFTRALHYGEHRCHIFLTHPIVVTSGGIGDSIEKARVDAIVKIAAGYIGISADDRDWQVSDETLEYIAKTVRAEQRRRKRERDKADVMKNAFVVTLDAKK